MNKKELDGNVNNQNIASNPTNVTIISSVVQPLENIQANQKETYEKETIDRLKGNKKGIFWLIAIFASANGNFFGNFFTAFANKVVEISQYASQSGKIIGFITSIRNLLSSLFQGPIGYVSDRIGRKMVLIIGMIINFIIPIPLLFFESVPLLITVAIIQAIGVSVFIPAWNAVLGDVTEPENRATFIGKVSSVGGFIAMSFAILTAIIFYLADGPLKGKVIFGWIVNIEWRVQYSISFGISAFSALLCFIVLLFYKETKLVGRTKKLSEMIAALKEKKFLKFVIVYTIFGLAMSAVWPLNTIIQIEWLDMDFFGIAIINMVFVVVMSIFQIIAGKLGDRLGRRPIIIIGSFILVLFPLLNLPSIFLGSWQWLILSHVMAGIGSGLFFVSINALTLDLAPEELMGSYVGSREMIFGIATFAGSLLAGFAIDLLKTNFGLEITSISLSIGFTIFRLITAIGFLFVAESLTKEKRLERINNNKK